MEYKYKKQLLETIKMLNGLSQEEIKDFLDRVCFITKNTPISIDKINPEVIDYVSDIENEIY